MKHFFVFFCTSSVLLINFSVHAVKVPGDRVDFAEPNILYVSLTGDDDNSGESFGSAMRTIKEAVDYANTYATSTNPIAVQIGMGNFSENNPITITNNYVSIWGQSAINTIIEPQNSGVPMLDISAAAPTEATNLESFKIKGDASFTSTAGSIGIKITGDGFYLLQNLMVENAYTGISFGHGTISYPTISMVVLNNIGPRSANTCIEVVGDGIGLISSTAMSYCSTGVSLNDNAYVQMNNWRSRGGPFTVNGTGLIINDSATAVSIGGTLSNHTTGISVENGTLQAESNVFLNNTTDLAQAGTGHTHINGGVLDTTKTTFATPANVTLNISDEAYDSVISLGAGADVEQKLIKVNNGQGASSPEIKYVVDYSGHSGLLYQDSNTTHESLLGVEATNNNAELLSIVKGVNAHDKKSTLKIATQTSSLDADAHWWELEKDNAADNHQFNLEYWDGTIEHAYLRVSPTTGTVWNDEAEAINFRIEGDNETNLFMVDGSNDRVGIGIAAPASEFHVYENNTTADTSVGLTTENAGTGDSLLQFLLTGVQRWVVGIDNSDSDKFKISSSLDLDTNAHLTIDTNGNIGLGTTTPAEQLEVNNTLVHTSQYNNGNSGSTPSLDWGNGNYQKLTLDTTSVTLSFTDPGGIGSFGLELLQDATGSRTVGTWDADILWPGGTAPTLSSSANAVDAINCLYNGNNYLCRVELDFK